MRNRAIVDEAPELGEGRSRVEAKEVPRRALSLMEQLYHKRMIEVDEWLAGKALRDMYLSLMPKSEGVSSYGQSPGGADPTRKGDRAARRLTGIDISGNGTYSRGPSRSNRSAHWQYQDAIFAMAGVNTTDGERVVDPMIVRMMMRVVLDTENPISQASIGQARSLLKSDKQISAVGATFIREHLRRLALHFCFVKGEIFK